MDLIAEEGKGVEVAWAPSSEVTASVNYVSHALSELF